MAIERILTTLIEHPNIGADELAELSQTNAHSVRTVLQRYDRALTKTPGEPIGRGRPPLLYAVKPEWRDILEARWEARRPRPGDPVERALAVLDNASLAAIDDRETPENRQRMVEMVQIRSRAARALVSKVASDGERAAALERIARAEHIVATLAVAVQPEDAWAAEPEAIEPAPALDDALSEAAGSSVMRDWWLRWLDHLHGLVTEFGAEWDAPFGVPTEGLSLVVDLIPSQASQVSTSLVTELRRQHPSVGIRVGAMPLQQRAAFLSRFGELAFDPIARKAELWVTCDSRQDASIVAWHELNGLAAPDHLGHAIAVASRALNDAVTAAQMADVSPEPALRVQAAFMRDIAMLGGAPNLWPVYGAPLLLDLGRNPRLKATAEEQCWTYYSDVHSSQFARIAAGLPMEQYA